MKRVYTDVLTIFPKSINKYLYSVTITDSYLRTRWVKHLKAKSNCFKVFTAWTVMVEEKTGLKVLFIRCDSGGEYDNEAFKAWAQRNGKTFERTAPHTSSQNGVAERYNGVLMDAVRAIMCHFNVPKDFWDYAMDHANTVLNMMPCKTLGEIFHLHLDW